MREVLQISQKSIESLGKAFSDAGMKGLLLPYGIEVATEQCLKPESLDVQIGYFSLKYGVCGIIGLWEACIDGKRLPPHSKVTIVLKPDDIPSIQVDFVGLIGEQKTGVDHELPPDICV